MYRHEYAWNPEEFVKAFAPNEHPGIRVYGIEIELTPSNRLPSHRRSVPAALEPLNSNRWYAKADSSIGDCGIECVSHPASLKWWQSGKWREDALPMKLPSIWRPTVKCGMHVHASIPEGRPELSVAVCKVWNSCKSRYAEDIERYLKLAMRKSAPAVLRYASPLVNVGARTQFECETRYRACTRTNHGIEVRIFASTRSPSIMVANITLVSLSIRYAQKLLANSQTGSESYSLVGFREFVRAEYAQSRNKWEKAAYARLVNATSILEPMPQPSSVALTLADEGTAAEGNILCA